MPCSTPSRASPTTIRCRRKAVSKCVATCSAWTTRRRRSASCQSLAAREKDDLNKLRKDLTGTTEYAPFWVILAVALALGLGTMVGWKRVVLTIGEKIGKQGMTYTAPRACRRRLPPRA